MNSNKLKTSCNGGFTLVELLVVVLIIGILVAVAVPQYKVAVLKTRTAGLLPLMDAVSKAQKNYYLANGIYADSFEKLDIDFPGGKNNTFASFKDFYCYLGSSNLWCVTRSEDLPNLQRYFEFSATNCWVANTLHEKICKSLSSDKKKHTSGSGSVYYFI